MSGQPKRDRLLRQLELRAKREIDEDATAIDYVEAYVQGGGILQKLADDLAAEMGESCSRPFLSNTVNKLSDDAKARIGAARNEGAQVLLEETLTIADTAPATTADVLKAKMQVNTRVLLAEKFAPDLFGTRVKIDAPSLGAVFIQAMQQAALETPNPPACAESGDGIDS